MKLRLFILILSISSLLKAQESLSLQFDAAISINADRFIGVDDFQDYYYIKGNTLYKKTPQQTYSYTNTQLGFISTVDITNPLKIIVFYRDFNTVLLLDNRLNELTDRVNLSNSSYGKNATFVSISSNNNLWIYSLDDNILSLWNYETKETVFESQPLPFYLTGFEALNQLSTYENCWLLAKDALIEFNQYGSFIQALELAQVAALQPYETGIIYLKNDLLYADVNGQIQQVSSLNSNHLSTNFFVNKNTLYFFQSDTVFKYRILKN